ncbi:LytR family transcriptional attenuator [Nocardia neocaledoniensis]|uniref:LytR family transcriptional attenuator n=2 Tax=Nocardia neocaledoniensis TaxID=236511 RepID=A0A317NRP3_9NOCA|nr:LCP family protein [Nocardia neocaledoniensis]PWV77971.1 LytR family transcriptional attenuator [Nocardia neocaledoniensis]
MGDDRRGRTPRPGSRAPWERYPQAEPTEQAESGSRRSRHADATQDPTAPPLTVQDLVDRVDSERTRRRRPPGDEPAPGSRAGRRAREQAPRPTPRPELEPRAAGVPPVEETVVRRAESPADRTATTALPTEAVRNGRRPAAPRRTAEPLDDPATDILPAVTEPPKRAKPVKTASAAPPRRPGADGRRNRQARMAGRVALTIFAVLTLVVTGGGWSYLRATGNSFTQVSALDGTTEDVLDGDMQLGDENYLIVGTDTRAGVNADMGAGTTDDAEGSRADTVMLVHIPKNRSRVVVVSFPRDLDVTRPQCSGWDNEKAAYTDEKMPSAMGDKLNAVYARGGPRCLVDVVRKMSGLSIGHFIGIDFAGFEAMVDQIGGVEVCSTKPIIDGVLGTVLETSGKQRVMGETALNYVRARHVVGEERSDYDRINRQQKFMASLLRGALSSKVLFDPGKLNGFIQAFTSHTFVDKVTPQDLLLLGRSLQKMDAGAVTFLTIPTAGTNAYGNEIPRETDIKAIFRAVIDDQPLPGEVKAPEIESSAPTPAPAAPKLLAVAPSTMSLLVSNGSGTVGAANRAATKLDAQGFQIYSTGNYAGGTSTSSKIRFAPGMEAEAATVASTIPGASLEEAPELGSIIEVVLGTDFAGTVRTATPIGTELPNVPIGTPHSAGPVALPSDLEHMNAADDTCK